MVGGRGARGRVRRAGAALLVATAPPRSLRPSTMPHAGDAPHAAFTPRQAEGMHLRPAAPHQSQVGFEAGEGGCVCAGQRAARGHLEPPAAHHQAH